MQPAEQPQRVRVQIVDDHAVFRRAIGELLTQDELVDVVAETNIKDALNEARRHKPEVVVINIHKREPGAALIAGRIRTALPQTHVIVVSAVDLEEQLLEVVRAGVRGYISRRDTSQALGEAIRVVASGEPYFEPQLVQQLVKGAAKQGWLNR